MLTNTHDTQSNRGENHRECAKIKQAAAELQVVKMRLVQSGSQWIPTTSRCKDAVAALDVAEK